MWFMSSMFLKAQYKDVRRQRRRAVINISSQKAALIRVGMGRKVCEPITWVTEFHADHSTTLRRRTSGDRITRSMSIMKISQILDISLCSDANTYVVFRKTSSLQCKVTLHTLHTVYTNSVLKPLLRLLETSSLLTRHLFFITRNLFFVHLKLHLHSR